MIDRNREKQEPRFCDVVAIFKLLTEQLTEARLLLEVNYMLIFFFVVTNLITEKFESIET